MWRLIEKLLQVTLMVATASTVFVVAVILWSSLAPSGAGLSVDPGDAVVEVRLSGHGDVSRLFVGQPLVVDVVLLNLQARRARNETQINPEGASAAAAILLDYEDAAGDLPWERRLRVTMSTPEGATVLSALDWHARLLDPDVASTGRRLALAPVRTTLVVEGNDLAQLLPGRYALRAMVPTDVAPPDRVTAIPLEFDLVPAPDQDTDRAVVSLAVARVAALRGEPAVAVEAALTALALDPLQDEALAVVAEGWEQQGDLGRAVEWYQRYLETLPEAESARRIALEGYVEALRQQRD